MTTPPKPDPIKNDVLHSDQHSHLTPEEIARAVARHSREHKESADPPPPQKKPRS